ncbi:MAG: hypothetical protein EOO88_03905 [Pedobacter sp.]|nr:MAG: hypothetical protein EOO88_03905 [Pedobacter sp.]
MLEDQYDCYAHRDYLSYEFVSSGVNGQIIKIVQYSKIMMSGIEVYNLGFGDLVNGEVSDKAVSNNGDMRKILATVASTVYDFTNRNDFPWIYAKGGDRIRTMLYQRKLRNQLAEISRDFDLYGLTERGWKEFRIDTDYHAFLIKRK